jgi:hypothetical protein
MYVGLCKYLTPWRNSNPEFMVLFTKVQNALDEGIFYFYFLLLIRKHLF